MTCEKCGSPTHRDDAMNARCNSCEYLVRQCICTPQEEPMFVRGNDIIDRLAADPITQVPGNLLLAGIVGSTAYGLDTPDSDVDRMGVYAAPTIDFHGLNPPVDKRASITLKNPDAVYHEVLKWLRLVLQCNPSVTELLWLDEYEVKTPLGSFLIDRRQELLSAHNVRNRYLGYATGQFQRLADRGDGSFSADTRKRTAKHARHILRLLDQGYELYSTGHLTVKVQDPERYHEFGIRVAGGTSGASRMAGIRLAEHALGETEEKFNQTLSPLPKYPNEEMAEGWLRMVRAFHWNKQQE